jgi:hypothetical protein
VTFIVPFSRCLETFFSEEIVEYPNPSLAPLKTGPAKHTTLIGKYVRDKYTVCVCSCGVCVCSCGVCVCSCGVCVCSCGVCEGIWDMCCIV